MQRLGLTRRVATAFIATAAITALFTGHTTAEPATVDWSDAVERLRTTAEGNPAAEQALDRVLAEREQVAEAGEVALPAQPFQVPAQSDIGRGGGPGVYGSGTALDYDGFRFGFFGGPGTIAPNQFGAKLEVVWLNLSNGRSGTEVLFEHNDVPWDTTIRSHVIDPGPGMTVAAVYGTLWHRWPVPVSWHHPDGYQYIRGTISFPSLGAVYS